MESSKATNTDWKYPLIDCKRNGLVTVDHTVGHQLFWEEYGNPDGEPVMFLHGGPGGACSPVLSRFFNPDRYRVILFDQRGCGKSRPTVASDGAAIALTNNTTEHLVEDMNKLRTALAIDTKMHVFGGSWGSTLAMAYAAKYPENVQNLVLRGIFIGDSADLRYLYQGNASVYHQTPALISEPGAYVCYPEEWREFVEVIPVENRSDMMAAYKQVFDLKPETESERAYQTRAAVAWSTWEGRISHLVPNKDETVKFGEEEFAVCFAQIEAHYFANNLFLPENYLVENVSRFAKIPVHIVHGRFDQVCPLTQAEVLVNALKELGEKPASYVITTAGHSALERENVAALTNIMDLLPIMRV